ncbi:MAG TPA: preprotein translocase subunit YajC, partial [Acidimicrobiales bacterium]|nr:preprotein translocase subunit YajC [Acidimicrobiales bacterium]
TTKSSGGSFTFIIFLVVIGAAGYFLLLRPQQQKARKQKALQSDVGVGDEVLTIGGIVGTVLDIDSDRVTIITAVEDDGPGGGPGQPTRLVLVRSAVARKIEPVVNEPEADDSSDAELHYDDEPGEEPEADADGGDGERRADGGSGEGTGP